MFKHDTLPAKQTRSFSYVLRTPQSDLAAPKGRFRKRSWTLAFQVIPGSALMRATSTWRAKSASSTPLGLQSASVLQVGGCLDGIDRMADELYQGVTQSLSVEQVR